MNNFPFFQHQIVKLTFEKDVNVDEILVDKVSNLLSTKFKLKIVDQGKHKFPNQGLTKFWILSQSHMVIHTWPENSAVHIDLMTCSKQLIKSKAIKSCLSEIGVKDIVVIELNY